MDDAPKLTPGKRLLFAAVPVVAVLAIAEIVLRLGPDHRWLDGEKLWELRYARSRRERPAGGGTHGDFPLDRHSPTLGWVSRPNHRSAEVNTNSRGLRGLREHTDPRPPGRRRIVVVGDSFTFGEDVADADAYPARLEELLPDTEVLNLGVHGYGTDQQHLMLLEQGLPRDPDAVVLGFYLPDVERNGLGFRDYAKPVYRLDADGRPVLHGVPVPSPEEISVREPAWWFPRLAGFVSVQGRNLARVVSGRTGGNADLRVSLAVLDLTLAACREKGVPLVLVIIPKRLEPDPRIEETALVGWAEAAGVPHLNMRPAFLELPEAERGTMYNHVEVGHWTPAAHALCARLLREKVEPLLPPAGGKGKP
jgi:hypothetical protein